jgi:hypothetical protein
MIENVIEPGVFLEGEFGVCYGCSRVLRVNHDLHDVHVSKADPSLVHFVWLHDVCGASGEVELPMEDFKASRSWLKKLADSSTPRVFSDSELTVQKFRQDMGEVASLKEIGWLTANGHE